MASFESEVVLRDGSVVRVRPPVRGDRAAVADFLRSLSPDSLGLRFLRGGVDPDAEATRFLSDDDGFALLALQGGRVVGQGAWQRLKDGRAEFSVAVVDALHGKGLGTLLLGQLADAASRAGVGLLEGLVEPGNPGMTRVLRDLGFRVSVVPEGKLLRYSFRTSLRPEAVAAFERRDAEAARAAVHSLLHPRGIAVVGASRRPESIGAAIFRNLLDGGFQGPVYPVNAKAEVVHSVVAYPSVLACPDPLDLAVLAVPARAVPAVARECARRGVRALVVISAGFAEAGGDGTRLQEELLEICREGGMRLVGPNCMGIANTDPAVRMNAQFSALSPRPGRVAFLSQSGALGIALIDEANRLGLGLSAFLSVGNKADLSGNDFLQYWEQDERTDLVLLYLESFGNPRRFARIGRRVAGRKPVIVVKSGRSAAGSRAAQSHTGALVRASEGAVDALFRQTGVIRTDTLGEMFDAAALLANQPAPRGNGVAIVSNGGGLGILAADACEDGGLAVPELAAPTQVALRAFLPRAASVRNPVDLLASASAADYGRAIRAVKDDPSVDALVVLFVPPVAVEPEEVAGEILAAAREGPREKPIATVFLATRGVPDSLSTDELRIPSFPSPESAARALAKAAAYGTWLRAPEGAIRSFPDTKREEAESVLDAARRAGTEWLGTAEVARVVRAYGIPLVETRRAANAEEAGRAAAEIGRPVALKAIAPDLVHKTDVGGVRLGLAEPAAVEKAAREMSGRLAAAGHGRIEFAVQPMVPDGVEMLVGVTHDPNFGPVLVCAAGGVLVELFRDLAVRLTPLTDLDAREMIRSLKTWPLLEGYRGGPRHDAAALEEAILRVAALVEAHPSIVELDLNPLKVLPEGRGVCAVDARVRIGEPPPRAPLGARREA